MHSACHKINTLIFHGVFLQSWNSWGSSQSYLGEMPRRYVGNMGNMPARFASRCAKALTI